MSPILLSQFRYVPMSILFCFKGSIIERFQAIRTYLVERQNLDSARPKKIDPITISPSLLKLDNAEDYSELDLHTILGKSYKSHVILNFCHMVMFRKKIGEKCIYFFKDFVTSKRWPMFNTPEPLVFIDFEDKKSD